MGMSGAGSGTRGSCGRIGIAAVVAGIFLALPLAGHADEVTPSPGAADQGWLAWVGCWTAVDDASEGSDVVCVRLLEEEGGALISTLRDGEIVSERVVRTDGRHFVERSGCEGWEEAAWSSDGRRLFLRSEMECADRVPRVSTGVFMLSPSGDWIDVQAVRVGDRADAGVAARRFAPMSAERVRELGLPPFPTDRELAARTARIHASAPLRLEDVAEASSRVDPAAVQVLLLEAESRFELSAQQLLDLRDQGVPDDVLDMVVAVSFPERFEVDGVHQVAERPAERRRVDRPARYGFGPSPFRSFRYRGFYHDPFLYDPFFYSGFYFGSPYSWRTRTVGPIIVAPRPPAATGGRVIQGRGYTRNRAGAAAPSRTESRPSPASTRGTRPPSGSSGVSPQGSRGSDDRRDTGRRAQPRGGGGGL